MQENYYGDESAIDYDDYDELLADDYDFAVNGKNGGGRGGNKMKRNGESGKGIYNQKHIRIQVSLQQRLKKKVNKPAKSSGGRNSV